MIEGNKKLSIFYKRFRGLHLELFIKYSNMNNGIEFCNYSTRISNPLCTLIEIRSITGTFHLSGVVDVTFHLESKSLLTYVTGDLTRHLGDFHHGRIRTGCPFR